MSGKGWWNSAISGLESRLDTILAEDGSTGPKPAAAAEATEKAESADKAAVDKKLAVEPASRNSSRSRPNSRLQDRLAKAVNKGTERSESRASSDLGSRPESPALRSSAATAVADTGRTSIDSKASEPATETTSLKEDETKADEPTQPAEETPAPKTSPPETSPLATPLVAEQPASTPVPTMSMPSMPSIVTPQTCSPRQSVDADSARPSVDAIIPTPSSETKDADEVQAELSLLQQTYEDAVRDNREELNSHLERIDALQSKLTYLSEQLAASAKSASSEPEATPADKKLAEKDAQIAALMEEGQKLSKTEMKHLTTIKKMRVKAQEQDKEIATLKQRLTKAEKSITEQSERARRAEAADKSSQEKLKIVGRIEKDIETIRAEREEAGLTISELRKQLKDALLRAEDAEKRVQSGALEAEKRATASLKEDVESIRIEKKLVEDRAKRELQAARDEAKNQQEKAKVAELELRGEIANLESKLELLRSRTEEASSSATGDSQAKLLRQIETLQTQYSLASENWQGIETSLTSRVAALEKDRDETAKRESDVRRKAREVNSKARRLEDELESINERARAFEHDLTEQRVAAQKLQAKLTQAEAAAQDARADLEKEKKVWESHVQQRVEEERSKWKVEMHTPSLTGESQYLRTDSPSIARRHSPDPLGIYSRRPANPRSTTGGVTETPFSPLDRMFDDTSRRPSSSRQQKSSSKARTPEPFTPPLRQDSIPSSLSNLNGLASMEAPSIHTLDPDTDPFDNMPASSSPHRTINDMISVSTLGAGPSVQLVERMSAAVRRLESEKATHKEELTRLTAQRDEARDEVVRLMREVDEARVLGAKVPELDKRLGEMENREMTALEMLGEKTERVEELEADVRELKRMYRELVDTMK
ncbi:M protein repeat protein [Stemphylium lycopersici]|nr:M protein repeat protein [Stemphylium lycopersici]